MSDVIKLRKGLDIRLKGKAETVYGQAPAAELYAIKPTDFNGLKPKMMVKEGEHVDAGGVLFVDKNKPEVKFLSAVSGTVEAVRRGERRAILEVVVRAEGEVKPVEVGKLNPSQATREQVIEKLLETGAWTYLLQRPYNVIADPKLYHKAVFISTFDTAPLAPDYDHVVRGNEEAFQAGVDALAKLAPVFIGTRGQGSSKAFTGAKNAKVVEFQGPHPAGCVGVQINHVQPINAGEVVLTVQPQEVVAIGKIFSEGKLDFSRVVVVTGPEVKKPAYYRTVVGAQVSSIVENNVNPEGTRLVSGNVLTGKTIAMDGFLGYHDSQLTALKEGNESEFMGWIAPGLNKFSASRTFFTWLQGKKEYRLDTNMHGQPRAIVVSGEMEKVLPMDIYPEHLLKAVMAKDIDKMIELGIFEVVEEDMALCEFVSTSKLPVQRILRNGLNLMMEEVG
ncbi:MAG: Na(+)-translocating NADH-quinone reductase subunit A [Bacteroidales bacterium]|jgi:Na+-transporting NADH:ubiquinone oxidoreductase subunit A|nr:Na(+)-translocating NADH-quinone reductase subunit A [Bacteroidales bacterium]